MSEETLTAVYVTATRCRLCLKQQWVRKVSESCVKTAEGLEKFLKAVLMTAVRCKLYLAQLSVRIIPTAVFYDGYTM